MSRRGGGFDGGKAGGRVSEPVHVCEGKHFETDDDIVHLTTDVAERSHYYYEGPLPPGQSIFYLLNSAIMQHDGESKIL